MNSQITPEQIQNLLTLGWLILLAVALRLICMAVWNKWLKDAPVEDLTQEERDERLVARRRRRRK